MDGPRAFEALIRAAVLASVKLAEDCGSTLRLTMQSISLIIWRTTRILRG